MATGVQLGKKKRNRYTPEFKAEAVRLMKSSGKPLAELAKNFGLSEQSLYRWSRQDAVNEKADPRDPLRAGEREEFAR